MDAGGAWKSLTIQDQKPKPKRSSIRCLSCRKLRIKCDEARPACEYCVYRNRECIYPDRKPHGGNNLLNGVTKKGQNSMNLMNKTQMMLNSMPSIIGITTFEYQLICYYNNIHKSVYTPRSPADSRLWLYEFQRFWFQSELVRDCIYAIGTMHLENYDLYKKSIVLKNPISKKGELFLKAHQGIFDMNELKGYHSNKHLSRKTMEYFDSCLRKTMIMINEVESGNNSISVFKAAEMFFSTILIFSLMSFHPMMFIPLVSVVQGEPDLLSICKGMKHVLIRAFPFLYGTPYNAIFENSGDVIKGQLHIPVVTYLKEYREEMNGNMDVLSVDSSVYEEAVTLLGSALHKVIIKDDTQPLWEWIFKLDDLFYFRAKQLEYYALKLLFYYSSIACLAQNCVSLKTVWSNYCLWFKDYNFSRFGKWRDYEDKSLFHLVSLEYYHFSDIDLEHFLPSTEIIKAEKRQR